MKTKPASSKVPSSIALSKNALVTKATLSLGASGLNVHGVFKGSPEVPEKMIWTASSIKQLRQCPRKFYWKYITRLRQKFGGSALQVGTAFHKCLAEWYRSNGKIKMEKIAAPVAKELGSFLKTHGDFFDNEEKEKLESSIATFVGMVVGYAAANDSDRKTLKFDPQIGVEREFLVDCGEFYYAGSIDGLPTVKGKQWLMEHKTASFVNEHYISRLALDTQSRGYMFAVKALTGKLPHGVIYNVTQKCKLRRKCDEKAEDFNRRVAEAYMSEPDKYFYREYIDFDADDIAAFCIELVQTHRHFMLMAGSQRPLDPRSWTIDDSQCNAWFKTCEYHGLCTGGGVSIESSLHLTQADKLHAELTLEEA